MEHITIEPEHGKYFKLIPDDGFVILDKRTRRTHSVVITDKLRYFIAVPIN